MRLVMLDLFCGFKGASAAMAKRGWEVITVDNVLSLNPTHTADLAHWSPPASMPHPDLIWASPPCQEFSRTSMPWTRARMKSPPSLALVDAAKRIISELNPRWWVIENVRGAIPYLGKPAKRVGPYFLWGTFPAFTATTSKTKEALQGWKRLERARVPLTISLALALACEAEPTWVRCDCCENYLCLRHGMHAHDCDCPEVSEWERSPYGVRHPA
jgi:hypothetical protein